MNTQRIETCAHGWIAEEIVPQTYDAVVYVYRRGPHLAPLKTIRCTTWERAREWVDSMQNQGYRTEIRREVAR